MTTIFSQRSCAKLRHWRPCAGRRGIPPGVGLFAGGQVAYASLLGIPTPLAAVNVVRAAAFAEV